MRQLFFLLGILFISTLAIGQANLTVTVTNTLSLKPIGQVKVALENKSLGLRQVLTTDAAGKAFFTSLPAYKGYQVSITDDNYFSEVKDAIELKSGEPGIINLAITEKNNAELGDVTVRGEKRIALNKVDATVSSYITKTEIETMPIEGRDVTKSLYRLPNVTLSTLGYNEAPNVAINGLSGIYTNYLIDGMDNNERFLGNVKFNTPFGFTENITVLTNNYSVEFGNTSNGIVNLGTRSGSNKFSGEVFYVTRPGKVIDSKSSFAGLDLYGNPVKDGFQRQQLGIGLGGAIKKDKTFFYLNLEQTFDIKDNLLNSPVLGINETVRGKNSFTYISGKLDQYWNKRFHSSLRANIGRFDVDAQGGGITGGTLFPSAGATQKNRTYLIALKNDYKITEKLSGETNFQQSFFEWNYRDNPSIGKPGALVQAPDGTAIASIGPANYIFDDFEHTSQFQQKFKLLAGKHTFKAGVEFTSSNYQLLGAGNSNGFYTVRLTQAQIDAIKAKNIGSKLDIGDIPSDVQVINYLVDLDKSVFGTRQNVFNVYAEDNFAVSDKLNLSLGLRFDYDNLSKAGGDKGDWNNIAPRFSFNYKIDNSNVIRGGYGIFYDKIKYSVTSDNLQFSNNSPNFKLQLAELQRLGILNPKADLNKITNPGNLKAFFDQGSTPAYLKGLTAEQAQGNRALQSAANYRIKNPDGYQNPYSHQFTLGYQHKVSEDVIFSIDIVESLTRDLFRITNLNTASSYVLPTATSPVRTTAAANLTRPVPIKTVGGQFEATVNGQSYRGIARDVFMTETKGRANYTALNLVMQKARGVNDNISYRVSYSLSRFKTDAEGINVRATDANNWDNEYNYGDNDRTHVLTGVLTWYAVKNLSLTPTLLFQSGQPITRYSDATKFGGVTDLNGNGENAYANAGPSDYQPGEIRNGGGRLPASTSFDFSAKYKISINGKPGIEISADIYNLLNTENLSGYSTARGGSNIVQIGPASLNNLVKRGSAPPRQFQFGVRYIF
ncbi:MAG: TonB-dependent receptor [Chitinophagaceae bacterium]